MQPYEARSFRFIELLSIGDWRMKLYGIASEAELPRDNDPEKLAPAKSSDSSVCVWDLHLQSFERGAWIKHVLHKPNAPDFDAYLSERLHEDV